MKKRSSAPQLIKSKPKSLYATASSTVSLPLRHSSKPRLEVIATLDAPTSHCQIETLPLTARHLQDLEKTHQYHLLYDLIGSRYYASCPELIARSESKERLHSDIRPSTFYQVKSRSSYKIQAPGRRPQSRASKIAHNVTSYVSACFGRPTCFCEEKVKDGRPDL